MAPSLRARGVAAICLFFGLILHAPLARASFPGPPPHLTPTRTAAPVTIDGVLDEPIWKTALEAKFYSMRSKPYGEATREPTSVQVAYDAENLYVAFRCAYSTVGDHDDSMPSDEVALYDTAERVGVLVDARMDRTNARSFTVGRTGLRGDSEITNNGAAGNRDWRGLWDGAAHASAEEWTAELKLPWGTLGLPSQEGRFQVGIDFLRAEPIVNEYSAWALGPPTIQLAPSWFGTLDGLEKVEPAQRLFVQPFLAGFGRARTDAELPALRDFTGTGGRVGVYGGAYARYRPPGPVQVDATLNPDFSAVPPDRAITNLDRFEVSFPEVRPFFAEDRPRFEMGIPSAQLFYTRRVGLQTNAAGASVEAPILYGVKSIVRHEGTQVAAMNVGLTGSRVSLTDNVTVLRFNESFDHGRRIGNLILARQGDAGRYLSSGVDGAYTLFDEHLQLSGFYARSATAGKGAGGLGEADIAWATEDYNAKLQVLDVERGFDGQLGFVPLVDIRSTVVSAFYTPVVSNDRVRQLVLGGQLDRTRTHTDATVYDRGTAEATASMLDGSSFSVKVSPSIEVVSSPFGLGANRITVGAGRYDVMVVQAQWSSPPRRTVEATLSYTEGDLFAGYRRNPSLMLTLNRGHFTGSAQYQLYFLRYDATTLTGHQLSVRSTYAYTPLARSTAILEWNTLTLRGAAQLVTAYQFGALSSIALVVGGTSGATPAMPDATRWSDRPDLQVVANIALGATPF
jgi:hypothetical protein